MNVAIVGGGYAGMAAAVELAAHGVAVRVFEAGPVLGGRARRITYKGVDLDNGAHILLGAYRETRRLMRQVGVPESALLRLPLRLKIKDHLDLRAPRLPSPLHVLLGLFGARGLTLGERCTAVRFMSAMRKVGFRLPADSSVASLLARFRQQGPLATYLWQPLCVAALNTPPEYASAQVFLNVLRDGLAGAAADSDLLLPRIDLSRLFPEAAAQYVEQQGGAVLLRAPVQRIEAASQNAAQAERKTAAPGKAGTTLKAAAKNHAQPSRKPFTLFTKDGSEHVDAVICAVGPPQTAGLLPAMPEMAATVALIDRLSYESICTVYLQYASGIALPVTMLGLSHGLAQWLFDRQTLYGQRGLIAAVISASGDHQAQDQASLGATVAAEIARHFPAFGEPLWIKVVMEKFATFACTPNLARPAQRTPLRHFYLAGDYTDGDQPATLEGAVRSGVKCAQLLLADTR